MSVFTNPASSSPEETAAYVRAVRELASGHDPARVLSESPEYLAGFVAALPSAVVTEPESPGKWSIAQVVQHLADSELVWGYRLRRVVAEDRPRIRGYDQDLWADRLRYSGVRVADALEDFAALRRANLRLLDRLPPEDLWRAGLHEERGEETLEAMLPLYAGHDLLHRRQVERIGAAVSERGSRFPASS